MPSSVRERICGRILLIGFAWFAVSFALAFFVCAFFVRVFFVRVFLYFYFNTCVFRTARRSRSHSSRILSTVYG